MSTTSTVVEAPQAQSISAETILRLFPDIDTTSTSELDGHDEEQIRLMDEVCIVLDENDQAIGTASKKVCTQHPLCETVKKLGTIRPPLSRLGLLTTLLAQATS